MDRGDSIATLLGEILTKKALLRTYRTMINLSPNPKSWIDVKSKALQPPPIQKQPSKPKVGKQKREPSSPAREKKRSHKCGSCQEFGHNRKRCKKRKGQSSQALVGLTARTSRRTNIQPLKQSTLVGTSGFSGLGSKTRL